MHRSIRMLQEQFGDERENVITFVRILEERSDYDSFQLEQRILHALRRFDLLPANMEHFGYYFEDTQEEGLSILLDLLSATRDRVSQLIQDLESQLSHIAGPISRPPDVRGLLHETTEYAINAIEYPFSQESLDALRDRLIERYAEQIEDQTEFYLMVDMVTAAVAVAAQMSVKNAIFQLRSLERGASRLRVTRKLLGLDDSLNIYRQAFINLMTIFDATVKDIVRLVLSEHFVTVMPYFAENKVTVSLADFRSFDELKDRIVRDNFEKRGLKEILHVLKRSANVEFRSESGNNNYVYLIEMINRRNIHVHARGFVDEAYLGQDKQGKTQFNIYKYELGEYAYIDLGYWMNATNLTRDCIATIVDWAESL